MKFLPWPDITNFHNLRRTIKQYPESLNGFGKVRYFAKIKLDGTNAAVIVTPNGEVYAQSRGKIITPNDDNMGFARWVESQKDAWSKLSIAGKDLIIFGEWSGQGIQKNVAVSKISKKIFAVFCVVFRNSSGEITDYEIDPETIKKLVKDVPDVHVLPWFTVQEQNFNVTIDWLAVAETLQPELDRINQIVLEVEACDPWIKENFGVEGIGEGLVFYPLYSPLSPDPESWNKFSSWLFKAKGEKHKTVKQTAPVQVDPEIANSAKDFAELVLTEARLEQGATAVWKTFPQATPLPDGVVYSTDTKLIGAFIKWIENDVKKETAAELEASKLTWDQVNKVVTGQARQWYLNKNKTL